MIILTLGALLNKRSGIRSRSPTSSPLLRRRSISPTSTTADPAWIKQRLPDNTKFEDNLTSRILSAFPFLVEILYWNLTYWVRIDKRFDETIAEGVTRYISLRALPLLSQLLEMSRFGTSRGPMRWQYCHSRKRSVSLLRSQSSNGLSNLPHD